MKSNGTKTISGYAVILPPFRMPGVGRVSANSSTRTSNPPYEVVKGLLVDRPLFRPRRTRPGQ